MFTLVLSVFPTTVADETDDEWFYSIDETVTMRMAMDLTRYDRYRI
jgi:hypothetical protein